MCLTDCVFEMKRETSVEEVNGLFKAVAENEDASNKLYGVLGYEERPLVSSDFTNDTHSGDFRRIVHPLHRQNPD